MKNLDPCNRDKKRYLLLIGKDLSKENIEKVILEFIGVLGYSEACPQIINTSKNKIILSINRNSLNKVRASFLISNTDIKISKVSGSVKKLK